jgi:hypothetical protein
MLARGRGRLLEPPARSSDSRIARNSGSRRKTDCFSGSFGQVRALVSVYCAQWAIQDLRGQLGCFPGTVSILMTRLNARLTYCVLLHGIGCETDARIPHALVTRMSKHLAAAWLLGVVDLFNTSLLAVPRGSRRSHEVLFVSEDRRYMRRDLLQWAPWSCGFGRINDWRVDGSRCQVA